ncbi:Crp/Fnr family transcriptional regulator [Psychroserpens luteolus]|uniref:Crp/Fnr family transcriptional regulator n=1 Tax=Psychroserpens luteolus TaxID=2855840 RepID=UPI001E5124ED|nr:Crp/Fnr family transcriptional regulator [Psychroserpens luteolus]MCD2259592.1 Crp/Fnr family transcriptional regulator [Psychroserpens luteolus]
MKITSLPFLNESLADEIDKYSVEKIIPENTELIAAGQYIQSLPFVLDGLVKVFTSYGEKEFLLYHIKPSESCVLSFITSNKNKPSSFFAKTEEKSKILFLPIHKVDLWIKKYPDFNTMYLKLFSDRYYDLIDTLNHVLFDRLDLRLHRYLCKKAAVSNSIIIKMSHKDISYELGTSREVISRVLKKLEFEKKVKQSKSGIIVMKAVTKVTDFN